VKKLSTEKLALGAIGVLVAANLLWLNFGRDGASCLDMRGVHKDIEEHIAANTSNPFTILYGTSERASDDEHFIANTVFFMKGSMRELSMAVTRKDCSLDGYVQ
jgi:hypothetical protein